VAPILLFKQHINSQSLRIQHTINAEPLNSGWGNYTD